MNDTVDQVPQAARSLCFPHAMLGWLLECACSLDNCCSISHCYSIDLKDYLLAYQLLVVDGIPEPSLYPNCGMKARQPTGFSVSLKKYTCLWHRSLAAVQRQNSTFHWLVFFLSVFVCVMCICVCTCLHVCDWHASVCAYVWRLEVDFICLS